MSSVEEKIAKLIVKEVSAKTGADYLLPTPTRAVLEDLVLTEEGFQRVRDMVAQRVSQILRRLD